MKLNELNLDGYKHIKNNDWDNKYTLDDWLYDHGLKKIGQGTRSDIYASQNENFVVKVNFDNLDEIYLKFVDFCHKNKNIHLPKIGNVKEFENSYIVFVEKLEKINLEYLGFSAEMNLYDFFNTCINHLFFQKINDDDLINLIKKQYIIGTKQEISNNLLKQFFSIIKIMTKFKEDMKVKNNLDLHSGNIMLRGNTLVVIDI